MAIQLQAGEVAVATKAAKVSLRRIIDGAGVGGWVSDDTIAKAGNQIATDIVRAIEVWRASQPAPKIG